MKKLLLILLCLPMLFSCGDDENRKTNRYFDNGQLKFEGNLKEGKQNGLWKHYYENGQLQLECNFIDGKRNGLFKIYYENGQLKGKGNVKDGMIDGPLETYYYNGQLKKEGNVRVGIFVSQNCWDEEGNKIKSQQEKDSIFIKESGGYILPIYIMSNNIILVGKYNKIFTQEEFKNGELLEKLTFHKNNLDKRNIPLTISLKVDKNTQLGFITDVKQILRKSKILKIKYETID